MIVIFDLDGTLINSKKRHIVLMKKILEKYEVAIPLDFEKSYIEYKDSGNSNKDYLLSVLKLPPELVNKIAAEWVKEIESDEMINYDTLYDDTLEILQKLREKNKIIYLSSRSKKETLISSLKKLKIYDYANEIYVTNPKNGSSEKSKIINEIKKNEDDFIVMIGDTEVDYKAASSANIKSYILNRGFRNKEYWGLNNIKSYNNLFECIDSINIYNKTK